MNSLLIGEVYLLSWSESRPNSFSETLKDLELLEELIKTVICRYDL